jgi:hypothetical protein
MKRLYNLHALQLLGLGLVITAACFYYWQTIMTLPLFGDATIHAANTRAVLNGGWKLLQADYPGEYNYLQGVLVALLGQVGYKLVPLTGFVFLCVATFLMCRRVTRNYYVSLLGVVLVACSPKIIVYSAKMYQEVLLSGIIIYAIYLLFEYLNKKNAINLYLLCLMTGTALSIKQQGLFILYTSLILFFAIKLLMKQATYRELVKIIVIPLVIGLGFYAVLIHNTGLIQPGSNEFAPLQAVNEIGDKILGHRVVIGDEDPGVNASLNAKLSTIEAQKGPLANQRAEERHIWPWQVFISYTKFNEANGLYLTADGQTAPSVLLEATLFAALLLGIFYAFLKRKKYRDLLIFTGAFLGLNYLAFIRNNDQQRYQVFLPIFLLVFILLLVTPVIRKIKINPIIAIVAAIIIPILIFAPILSSYTAQNTWWSNSQLYSPSIGGIASVQQTGSWLYQHTSSNTLVGQQCGNETAYYANRQVLGDWRIYFLNLSSLRSYFSQESVDYYVIYDSQVVPDSQWDNVCWVPQSFVTELNKNYSQVFTSQAGDIHVYKIN